MSELLTDAEVTVLNAARSVLKGITQRACMTTAEQSAHQGLYRGRLAESCDRAEGSIFQMLNCAQSYNDVKLTYEQLHMRPDPKEAS